MNPTTFRLGYFLGFPSNWHRYFTLHIHYGLVAIMKGNGIMHRDHGGSGRDRGEYTEWVRVEKIFGLRIRDGLGSDRLAIAMRSHDRKEGFTWKDLKSLF